MEGFHVVGGERLMGEARVEGAKNAVLPILAAALLPDGDTVLAPGARFDPASAKIAVDGRLLQAAAAALLMKLCAAVYGALMIHRGEKVGLKQVLRMAKGGARA